MTKLLLLLVLTLSGCATGGWTARDAALETTGLTLLAADYAQTQQITRDPHGPGEANKIIGVVGAEAYFVGFTVAHMAVSRALPKPWRTVWQSVVIGAEIEAVSINAQWGYPLW
jgi:hypothetical protein